MEVNSLSLLLQNIGNLFTWFVVVAPWEQALRVRLGKHVRLLNEGCFLRIPFIDRVYRHTTRRRLFVIRPQVLTTTDEKTITISGAVGFRIENLRMLFDTLHDAIDTIEAEIAMSIADYVSDHSLEECRPRHIKKHVYETIDIKDYGLADQEFSLTNYAVVRTFRFIGGDIPSWSNGNALNTTESDNTNSNSQF